MKKTLPVLLLTLFASVLVAQPLYNPGGRSLLHLQSAWVLEKSTLTLQTNMSSYYNTVIVPSNSNGPVGSTFWQRQAFLGANYATGKYIEWGLAYNIYQDTQDTKKYTNASTLDLKMKIASVGGLRNHFRLGLVTNILLPLGDHYNIPFEPYTSGTTQFGFTGLLSYSNDLLIPEAGFNFHLNAGIIQHTDKDQTLTNAASDTFTVEAATRELAYGAAFVFPSNQLDIGLEVFGRAFASQPPVTAFGREDYLYLTPFLSYRFNRRFSFKVGVDIRLLKDDDETQYANTPVQVLHNNLPNYPGWRLRSSFKFYITKPEPRSIRKTFAVSEPVKDFGDFDEDSPATLQDRLVRERRKTEIVEEDLERVRHNRQKMEMELNNLRNILHGDVIEAEQPNNSTKVDEVTTRKDGE
ncbi:MAG: hypothetical protein DWQ10_01625 [Calditrichaeota bacterium]|nr:MAG: hypothetical protein DWQ10_01625 [Calditrichota bacterium]